MADSPAAPKQNDCDNGKRKMIIREREYDALSWHGLKMIGSLLAAVAAVIVAVLTAYYSAEAKQNGKIANQARHISNVDQRQCDREKAVDNVLVGIKATLTEQGKLIRESNDTLIEVKTVQKIMKERLDEINVDVKKLRTP
jgi:peptidoglycan hydrolase CwlO-like protein